MIEIILTGTGSPMVDPNRAGPSTVVTAGGQTFLVDCGRGVLMRAAAADAQSGVAAPAIEGGTTRVEVHVSGTIELLPAKP